MEVKEIERKILTSHRKEIYRPFMKAIIDYNLVSENDSICVCISGGKDSLVMAKCMQELQRHGKYHITCKYVLMNPGYQNPDLDKIMDNAHKMGIPLEIYTSDIFERVQNSGHKSPCYVCAKMRRGSLYDYAKKNGCNKIALGHHFDDVITTTMLSILYGGVFNTMNPKVNSENFEGMQMIRPMYLVREKDILAFIKSIGIIVTKYTCPLKKEDFKRNEVKKLIQTLKEDNPFVEYNIFKASENVEVESIRGIIKNNSKINFNDYFDNL